MGNSRNEIETLTMLSNDPQWETWEAVAAQPRNPYLKYRTGPFYQGEELGVVAQGARSQNSLQDRTVQSGHAKLAIISLLEKDRRKDKSQLTELNRNIQAPHRGKWQDFTGP